MEGLKQKLAKSTDVIEDLKHSVSEVFPALRMYTYMYIYIYICLYRGMF